MTWQAGEHRKVDASEIGLAPGKWPPGIEYESYTFYRQETIRTDDDPESCILWVEYKERTNAFDTRSRNRNGGGGRRMTIFND